jgi:hypothetical protein
MAQVTTKGVGFLYWCKETGAEGRVLDTAWMRETTPPYRAGKAVRVRIGSRAVHLGLCKKTTEFAREVDDVTAREIGQWGS